MLRVLCIKILDAQTEEIINGAEVGGPKGVNGLLPRSAVKTHEPLKIQENKLGQILDGLTLTFHKKNNQGKRSNKSESYCQVKPGWGKERLPSKCNIGQKGPSATEMETNRKYSGHENKNSIKWRVTIKNNIEKLCRYYWLPSMEHLQFSGDWLQSNWWELQQAPLLQKECDWYHKSDID